MKFSPSSSISSSTTSFSENFCTSKGNTLGCFTGFLSRILFSKSLPTYPSDPLESYNKQEHFMRIETIADGSATPNVVARLMGLDTMPEFSSKRAQKGCDFVARSKSFGAGDFREETAEMQGLHRRAKTSFSFRETPTYFELQDDDFLVLSFENRGDKKKKGSSNRSNSEVDGKRCRQRKEKSRRKQRRNRDEQGKDSVFTIEERLSLKISPQNFDNDADVSKQSYHLSPFKDMLSGKKEEIDGIKARKKKKENCLESKDEVDCDLENASPVSVLDDSEFISDPEVTTSEEDAKSRGSEIGSEDLPSTSNGSSEEHARETNGNEERNLWLKRRDYKKHGNIEVLRRVFRLAEVEISTSNWKYRGTFSADDLEDTSTVFSQLIFDQLVSELVDELIELQCQEF